jgi:hypothetical protein
MLLASVQLTVASQMHLRVLPIQNTSALGNSCAWPKGCLRQSHCSGHILQISLQWSHSADLTAVVTFCRSHCSGHILQISLQLSHSADLTAVVTFCRSHCIGHILQISLQAQKTFLTYESGHRCTTVRLAQRSPPFWHKGSQRRAHAQIGESIVYHVGWTSQHYFRRTMTRHFIESLKQDSRQYRIHSVRLRSGPRFKGK